MKAVTVLTCYCKSCEWQMAVKQIDEAKDVCPECGSTRIGMTVFTAFQPAVSPDYQPRGTFVASSGGDGE